MTEDREPDVIISVKGGVADLVRKRPDLVVEIHDYDIEGCTEEELETTCLDENGYQYFQAGWFGEE